MSTIVLRSVKGLPLTNQEVDDNFSNLNTDKLQIGGTFSAGTANGVAYLNGSKVLTTGSALTYNGTNLSLDAAGAGPSYLEVSQRSRFGYDGTNVFISDAGTGKDIVFTRISEQMRLTSTGLGIGTSSPGQKLDVFGGAGKRVQFYPVTASAITDFSTGGAGWIISRPSDTAMVHGIWSYATAGGSNQLALSSRNDMVFATGNTPAAALERLRITSAGNVGIGTSSPTSPLHVIADASGNGYKLARGSDSLFEVFQNSTGGTFLATSGSLAAMVFSTGTTVGGAAERARISASGNFGLGVTPSAWGSTSTALQNRNASFWATNAAAYLGYNYFFDGSARKYIASSFATEYTQLNGQHIWYTAPSGTAGNAITFTQAMTLDASGRLLLDTTSSRTNALSSGTNLQVEGLTSDASAAIVRNSADASGSFVVIGKSRGTSVGSFTSVASGDLIGQLSFQGADGTGLIGAAAIRGEVDGTPGTNDMPGRLVFSTTADGTSSPTERMRIDSSGNVGIGTSSPDASLDIERLNSTDNSNVPTLRFTDADTSTAIGQKSGQVEFATSDAIPGPSGVHSFINGQTENTSGLGALVFGTGQSGSASEKLRITSAGNVGIGTSSPNTSLEISTTVDPILRLNNSTHAVTAGADIGEIQFYTNDASTNGTGVKAFVKTVAQAFGASQGGADLVFGTAAYAVGNASEKMRIDKDGNLGLGVTPSAWNANYKAIQVKGASFFQGAANTEATISANNFVDGVGDKYIATAAATAYTQFNGQHIWKTAPSGTAGNAISFTQAMVLDASGNLGVASSMALGQNSSTPTISFTHFGAGRATIDYTNASGNLTLTNNYGAVIMSTGSSGSSIERARIDSSGNLLVGATIASGSRATISSAANYGDLSTGLTLTLANSAASGSNSSPINVGVIQFGNASVANSNLGRISVVQNNPSASTASFMQFFTNNGGGNAGIVERARITVEGHLLVGATSGSTNIFKNDRGNDQTAYFQNTNNSNPFGIYLNYPNAAPNNGGSWFISCRDSGTNRMQVYSNGGIANFSGNNVNLSDRREKTNFAPAKSYLDTICAIPVQTFNYIDQNMEEDGGLTLGVVAQDVQAVAPELVMESNWGTKDEPKQRLSIYQTDLQYALMKCIQEQQAIITALTARITALESN